MEKSKPGREKDQRETHEEHEPEGAVGARNALDSWLRRELRALYEETEREELPPGIAELAQRLEDRLRSDRKGEAGAGVEPPTGPRGRKR